VALEEVLPVLPAPLLHFIGDVKVHAGLDEVGDPGIVGHDDLRERSREGLLEDGGEELGKRNEHVLDLNVGVLFHVLFSPPVDEFCHPSRRVEVILNGYCDLLGGRSTESRKEKTQKHHNAKEPIPPHTTCPPFSGFFGTPWIVPDVYPTPLVLTSSHHMVQWNILPQNPPQGTSPPAPALSLDEVDEKPRSLIPQVFRPHTNT